MSKENVFKFLTKAAQDEQLQGKLQAVTSQEQLASLGKEQGFEFSSEQVEQALSELKQKPGFFRALAEAVLEVFSPNHDSYPAIGVQPFTGEPNRKS